ncbi:Gfo/Idh/MocA family oxidoreductase [Candidatus Uhrbacteria bacterium]|jgi:myo-inositol 2-dehydrogenase / D-chiro-inositol 1-dehydrogenase|nr:Gfo/Idh/MocA family oxidoreductase [Candidatus Uhrbacteria bacterium]
MNELNIGIIGAGYIGREHARSIRLTASMFGGKVKLAAIADKNLEAAKAVASDYDIPLTTDDVDKILDDPNINVVFSCVPTKFHIDIIRKATKKGKAVFCEKPFAVTLEQAHEVHEILTNSSAPHQVGFVLRYAPTYVALKKILDKQSDNSPLRHISLRDDQKFPISGIQHYTDWRSDVKQAGAGVLIEHGIHDIDLFEHLFGKIKRVSATQRNHHSYEGIEDFIEIRIEFESGQTATMTHMWHDIPAHTSVRSFEIFFNKSLVTLQDYAMHHINVRDQEAEKKYEKNDLFAMLSDEPLFKDISRREDLLFMSDYYAIQDYWFMRNLLSDTKPSPSIYDGLRAFEIAHACYKSARENSDWVEV